MILILGKSPNLRKRGFIDSKPPLELFWVDSMVDFLYGMNWKSYIEEKWERMVKSAIFWANLASGNGTKLRKGGVVPVPIDSRVLVLVPVKWYWCRCFLQPYFCMLCIFKSRIRTPIFKDLNK